MIKEKNCIIKPDDLKIINNLILEEKISFTFKNNSTPRFVKKDFYFEHCIIERKETAINENRNKSIYIENFLRVLFIFFLNLK